MTKITNYIRGDSRTLRLTVKDANNQPFDLTGSTIFFTLRTQQNPTDEDDSEALLTKTVTSHSDPTNGITLITLTNADTQDLPVANHWYDVQLKDASGNIVSLKQDRFQVIPDSTRRIT